MTTSAEAAQDVQTLSPGRPARSRTHAIAIGDQLFRALAGAFAALVLLAVFGVLVVLLRGSWPAWKTFGLGFLASKDWNPVTGHSTTSSGAPT